MLEVPGRYAVPQRLFTWNGADSMKMRMILVVVSLALASSSLTATVVKDPGARDHLRLAHAGTQNGEYSVTVQVENDQELASLDIPLRFGQPGDSITLKRVEWSERVAGWEFKHAAIDNERKTVILGLISELTGTRSNANLAAWAGGNARIATLVFSLQGNYKPIMTTFTTEHPEHSLTYIFNRYENGKPIVQEFSPEFEVASDD